MKAIVLFWNPADRTDSEEFAYPNVDEVDISVDGVPSTVYTQGIEKTRYYEDAWRLFCHKNTSSTTLASLFKNRFALVVDLRTHADRQTVNTGRKLVNPKNGI